MDDWIKRLAEETASQVMGQLAADAMALCQQGGGPLANLFLLERKAELKTFCKKVEITKKEFSQTVLACEMGLLPWRHHISHRNFVPQHLEPTEEEWESVGPALASGDRAVPKALRKIMNQFDERRLLVGHIFYNHDLSRWHLLYFDQRDTSAHGNHWKVGAHVHLINWVLRTGQNANEAWQEFHDGNPKLRGALHIKCAFR